MEMSEYETDIKRISAEKFIQMDDNESTVLDLREPDEVLVNKIEGAVNVPFSKIGAQLDKLPKDKPVYVICGTGDLSEEVTEILMDRGYDAYNIDGGYNAYSEAIKKSKPVFVDARGLKCPGPVVMAADAVKKLKNGMKICIEATEDAFYSDIKVWCDRTGNRLLDIHIADGIIRAVIEKGTADPSQFQKNKGNDKTFVIFSGDLDKTIAAFVMANGAAAMGRKVTMFFTFWGLNVLRRPEKVSVVKSFKERLLGMMMPGGIRKLGLSRMNMCGVGAKMIRSIMKSKGAASPEELLSLAIRHGVRLVACQMSMDIMGIRKNELIDGVELGGVSTFLGAGEQSDMSLFI